MGGSSLARGVAGGDVRRANLLALLDLLRDGEPRCTPDLGGDLRLDPSTVTRLLSDLRSRHLVKQIGVAASGGVGRPPKVWRLQVQAGSVIGLNIVVDSIHGVLTGLDGKVIAEYSHVSPYPVPLSVSSRERPTSPPDVPPPSFAEAIREVKDGLLSHPDAGPLVATGVAVTGAVDHAQGTVRVGMPTAWVPHVIRDWPISSIISEEFGCPVMVGNDANVAALAAFRHAVRSGAMQPDDSLAYCLGIPRNPLWWGSLGFILGGRLHTGSSALAGELYYARPPDHAGHPFDAALQADARRVLEGDLAAAERLREILRRNVHYMVSIVLPLDPKRVLFGGSYAAFGPVLGGVLRECDGDIVRLHRWLPEGSQPALLMDPLWPHTLELGAASMALDRLYGGQDSGAWDILARVPEVRGITLPAR